MTSLTCHDGFVTWKRLPYYGPFCGGIHGWVTCGFPHIKPVMRNLDVCFDVKGTAHLKRHSVWRAIFQLEWRYSKLLFRTLQTSVERYILHIFLLQILVIRHCFSVFCGKHLFIHFWIQFLNAASHYRFCFGKSFSKYGTFYKKMPFGGGGGGVDFIFFINFGHDVNRISTISGTVFGVHIMYFNLKKES